MSFLGGWGPRGIGDAADEPSAAALTEDPEDGLGSWLRTRREERGYDLDRVERDTRISRGYIEAIEREQYDTLPAPVYARGFVRSYARYLGLDEDEALGKMPGELPRPPGLEPLPGLRRREGPPAIPALPWRWVAVLIVVVAAGATAFFFGVPAITDMLGDDGDGTEQVGDVPPAATVGPFEEGTMPDLRNVELAEARRVLAEIGVAATRVIEFEIETDDTPPGRVFGHSPSPGQLLGEDEVVNLFISREAPPEESTEPEASEEQ